MASPSNVVYKSTCRIVCDGGKTVGTGFFFAMLTPKKPEVCVPFFVTNKHVVKDAVNAIIRINVKESPHEGLKFYDLQINNVGNFFINHPDESVDLCVCPMGPTLNELKEKGIHLDTFMFDDMALPKENTLLPVEDVFMTGYPTGLWDSVNNAPITRKGITATNFNVDWNGKSEFLIDIACFGGSSGSPVYVMNEGVFTHDGVTRFGSRLLLLGILYSGPVIYEDGLVDIVNIPTALGLVSKTKQMINLGVVIKAERLNDFKPLLGIP